ncbi:hypothetical protein H2248_002051 [Termitomyces sp. 'cryptogamus']|nr:hypothetical protein H2248_002051 [Termitomyces sp. 'cryptogamus']
MFGYETSSPVNCLVDRLSPGDTGAVLSHSCQGSAQVENLVVWSSDSTGALSRGSIDDIPAFATISHYSSIGTEMKSIITGGTWADDNTSQSVDKKLARPVGGGPCRESLGLETPGVFDTPRKTSWFSSLGRLCL